MNEDFRDLLRALRDAEVRYLVVGAYAVSYHAAPRATADLDVWVEPTPDNASRVLAALAAFGAPAGQLAIDDLTSDDLVYQIGVAPRRIDLMTGITGVTFAEAWVSRAEAEYGGVRFPLIGLDALIRNKRALGRPRDLEDLAALLARKS